MATANPQTEADRYAAETTPQFMSGPGVEDMVSEIVDDVIALYERETDIDTPGDYITTFEGDRLSHKEPAEKFPSKTLSEMVRVKVSHPELRKANLEIDPDERGGFNDWALHQCDMDAEAEGIILSVQKRRYELH